MVGPCQDREDVAGNQVDNVVHCPVQARRHMVRATGGETARLARRKKSKWKRKLCNAVITEAILWPDRLQAVLSHPGLGKLVGCSELTSHEQMLRVRAWQNQLQDLFLYITK
jgi:hypothetical protein